MDKNKVVIDIETKKAFSDISGRHKMHELEISFVGLYSFSQDKYFGFFEKDFPVLEKILAQDKPEIIGYNTLGFDNPILDYYLKGVEIKKLPQLDIMKEVYEVLGFRLKLDSLAQATLGEGKSADGLQAIQFYRSGKYKELAEYCLQDVKITKEIYDYGAKQDKVLYHGGGELREAPVSWGEAEKIANIIDQGLKEHEQMQFKYLDINAEGVGKKREIIFEPQSLKEGKLTGFNNDTQASEIIDVNRIIDIKKTGSKFAHQGALI